MSNQNKKWEDLPLNQKINDMLYNQPRHINKNEEEERWKLQMKEFVNNKKEDALFVHNMTYEYYVANNEELETQFEIFGEKGLELYQANIKHFTFENKKFVMITINGENVIGSYGERLSPIAFALNQIVCGYTYIIREHSWKKLVMNTINGENVCQIYEKFGIKYIKK